MSHTVKMKTQFKDPEALAKACEALGLAAPVNGTHVLYDGVRREGLGVKLPGWTFPVVVDTTTGEISYDNFGGSWGDQARLSELRQEYAAQAVLANLPAGYTAERQKQKDGSLKMVLTHGASGAGAGW